MGEPWRGASSGERGEDWGPLECPRDEVCAQAPWGLSPQSVSAEATCAEPRTNKPSSSSGFVSFHLWPPFPAGNMVEWCLPQDIDLEGVEFKSMASGSHKIQSDFM